MTARCMRLGPLVEAAALRHLFNVFCAEAWVEAARSKCRPLGGHWCRPRAGASVRRITRCGGAS